MNFEVRGPSGQRGVFNAATARAAENAAREQWDIDLDATVVAFEESPKAPVAAPAPAPSPVNVRSVAALGVIAAETVAHGGTAVGRVVMYDAESLSLPRLKLSELFVGLGFVGYVDVEATMLAALRRACARRFAADIRVEAFIRPNTETAHSVGVYRLTPGAGESGDALVCGARVQIDTVNQRFIALAPEGGALDTTCEKVAADIVSVATQLLTTAETVDVTTPAKNVVIHALGGVRLTARGGGYFIPAASESRWLALCAALAPYGFLDRSFQVAASAESLAKAQVIAVGGLERDIADVLVALEKVGEKTRESTIDRKVAELDLVLAKADLFAGIIGDNLAKIQDRVRAAKAAFRAAFDTKGAAPGVAAASEPDDPFSFGDASPKANAA